jgi:hypothetical protein
MGRSLRSSYSREWAGSRMFKPPISMAMAKLDLAVGVFDWRNTGEIAVSFFRKMSQP